MTAFIGRREFITLLGGAAAAWPLAARAQQAGRTYRLGILHNQGPQAPQFPPFYDELRRLGFAEGQNLIVDSRGYAARTEQFPAVAAELVKSQVDAILAGGAAASRVAQAATRTIPIFTLTDDMVGQGLAASLARPGGNITGISILATELDGKRQEILMEMVPLARRIAMLADANTAAPGNIQALREAARARGAELVVRLVERPEQIVPEIEEVRRSGSEALNVLASPILYTRRLDIFERTAALRLPAIYQSPEFAEEGGLIGYGPRLTQMFRQLAAATRRILKGEKSATCRSSSRPLSSWSINLQTAKCSVSRCHVAARCAPTRSSNEAARVHHAAWRCGGGVAVVRAGAAAGDAGRGVSGHSSRCYLGEPGGGITGGAA